MIKVLVDLDDPNDVLTGFAAGALIRLEHATSEAGVYSEITTVAVVADTYQYEYWHSAGTTASWYRWRVSNAANTVQSGYSDAYQGIDAAQAFSGLAYATLPDLLVHYEQVIDDTRVLSKLAGYLVDAAADINEQIGRDFFRHPATGTETRVFDGSGDGSLCVHEGIVPGSVTLVEVSETRSSPSYTSLVAADWELDPRNPLAGAPADHILLTGYSYTYWPELVRITGAFGPAEPPPRARRSNIERARQLAAADPSLPGGIVGSGELGRPAGTDRMPQYAWKFIWDEQHRHWCDI